MRFHRMLAAAMLSALAACGGGGGGSSGGHAADPSGNVAITATTTSDPVGSGGSVQFDLEVRNVGTAAVSNVVASLALGLGLTRTSLVCTPSGGAACPADPASMSVASLPANGSLHYQVLAALAAGSRGEIVSTAAVTANGQAVSGAGSVPLSVQAFTADVQVLAQAPSSTPQPGGSAAWTVTVSNAGPDAARRLDLQSLIDAQQALGAMSCAASGGATCPATLGVHMTLDALPAGGALVFTLPATVAPDAIGLLADTLVVQVAGDPVPANNAATATATTGVDPRGPTSFIALQSDNGDYVGASGSWLFTHTNSVMAVTTEGGRLRVDVHGDHGMQADFVVPSALAQLQPGTWANLARYPFNDAVAGGLDVSGDSRGCNTLAGSFTVDSVSYAGATLTAIDLHFEQHCEGAVPALRGRIHWLASDTSTPPGPVTPVPATLWRAPAGTTPATGNYVYLQSDAGDFVGAGSNALFTQANAVLTLRTFELGLGILYNGDTSGTGSFAPMSPFTQLQAGYYGGAKGGAGQNPAKGTLDWGGDARGCDLTTGWFAVDHIEYTAGAVSALDLRFEQHCEDAAPALHGQVHWVLGDTTAPVGPQDPPPATLWRPDAGATPATGSYVYLQSDSGDPIGAGQTWLYTQANATLTPTLDGPTFSVGVDGDQNWGGSFEAMNTLAQLRTGYYPNLLRYPFNNPTMGGMEWSGEGRGCNRLTGWFVVDAISFAGNALASIDLRFEQHCEGMAPALRGQIHWAAGDPTTPAGPLNPPPAGLWTPPANATPATGSYVYLQSDAGDYVGAGQTLLYPASTTPISVTGAGALATVIVGPSSHWNGSFQGMDSIAQLQPGYYGHLQRYPGNNPTAGGLSWWGEGNSCNTENGWFVVDGVSYANGAIASLDVRFEQHCAGVAAALHGKIHWSADSSAIH